MATRCRYRLDVRERRAACFDRLEADYPRVYDGLDPDVVEIFDDLDTDEHGRWRCPRRAERGDRCVLHAPDATDAAVIDAIRDAVRDGGDTAVLSPDVSHADPAVAARRFIGVTLDVLDLRGWRSLVELNSALDFRCASVDRVLLADTAVGGSVRFDGAFLGALEAPGVRIDGRLGGRFADVDGAVVLDDATVDGRVDWRFARLHGDASLTGATADDRFDFAFVESTGALDASRGVCGGRFTLKESAFTAVTAPDVTVAGPDADSDIPGLQFRGLETDGDVDLSGADVDGSLIGYRLAADGDVVADGADIDDRVLFGIETGTKLEEARITGTLSFAGGRVGGEFALTGRRDADSAPAVGGKIDLSNLTVDALRIAAAVTHPTNRVVDLRGATIERGRLAQPAVGDSVCYDLEHASLGDVRITTRGGFIPDHVWLNRTTFDGFTFVERERRDFASIDWRLVDDPPEKAESVAYSRVFGEATAYARDLETVLRHRQEPRRWLRETAVEPAADSFAERLFDPLPSEVVEQIARNGPENAEQLGDAIYERERYRRGIVTALADRVTDTPAGATPDEGDDLSVFFPVVRRELRDLAEAAADPSKRSSHARAALRDAIASALAEHADVSRSPEEKELTYVRARKGADDVGDNRAAGRFYENELRVRRRIYRRDGNYRRYVANGVFDLVAGYGERPGRVFAVSTGLVGLFAAVYYGIDVAAPSWLSTAYQGAGGAVLLSLASFSAFVLGGAGVSSRALRFVANTEAFLGAFLIALFVFALTRSLHR